MNSSATIQDAHELAVLADGIAEHNRLHALHLTVISRPDPPDAILSDGVITTWMEVTDAFFSNEWARHLSSHSSIKGHKPMAKGHHVGVDGTLADNFCDLVIRKAGKNSYQPLVQQYGPGILVIGLESPWLDGETLDAIDEEWAVRGNPDISATFAHVYIRIRDQPAFAWPRALTG